MKCFYNEIKKFLVAEDGPTAVEYAVMLALVVVVCLATITQIGQQANTAFNNIQSSMSAAAS
jgi:pilus assembly protein Flp/PilA